MQGKPLLAQAAGVMQECSTQRQYAGIVTEHKATAATCTCRRMDFSVACAYAHGTKALRTHLINMTPRQRSLTWPAFSRLRKKWAGKVSL